LEPILLRIEEVCRIEDLERYKAPWDALLERSSRADLLQTSDWMLSWLNAFWQDRPIAFYFVWRDERLAAIFPFLPDKKGHLWCKGTFPIPVNVHSGCADLVYEGDFGEALDALIDCMERRDGVATMGLKNIPSDAATLKTIEEKLTENRLSMMVFPSGSYAPFIEMTDNWESYLQSRSRRVRRELLRKRRALESKGGRVEWRVFTQEDQLGEALEAVLAIERNSWKERCGTSITSEVAAEPFYRSITSRFAARGWLRIYLMTLDGRPLAHILGAAYRGRYYAFKTSFDKAFCKLSPGVVLFQYALEDLKSDGLNILDFIGNGERWKQEMATGKQNYVDVCVFSCRKIRCQICRLYNATLKPFSHEYLAPLIKMKNTIIQTFRAGPAHRKGS
jgi:hypothetical protein